MDNPQLDYKMNMYIYLMKVNENCRDFNMKNKTSEGTIFRNKRLLRFLQHESWSQ